MIGTDENTCECGDTVATPAAYKRGGNGCRGGSPASECPPDACTAAVEAEFAAGYQTRRDFDAGKPVLRSLLRNAGRRARLWRSGGPAVAGRKIRIPPAGHREPEGVSAAVSPGHSGKQRAENSLHQPRLGRAARGVERRPHGSMAARPPQSGRSKSSLCDGLSHEGGHSVPICSGGVLYDLRRLPLLLAGPHLAESDVPDDGSDRCGRAQRRTYREEYSSGRRVHLDHLSRAGSRQPE
jgi:hypothetical protein